MTGGVSQESCIDLMHRLADLSGAIALQHFRTAVAVDAKSDDSPVTIADRDAETAMRAAIRKAFPDHGLIGEEHGRENEGAEYLWILDPIDGTASFINGAPLFGTLIGLWRRGKDGQAAPWLGCINHPALKERWIGGVDVPTTFNGRRAKVRACPDLADATVYLTGPDYFVGDQASRFARLEKAVHRRRYGGTDCYHYAMVASGWTDIACEAGLKLHDYGAIVPVLQGAGATVSDWNGKPLKLESEQTVGGCVLACGDAGVHAAAVKLLSA